MALQTINNTIRHIGDNITVSFPYDYRVDQIGDLQIIVDGQPVDPGDISDVTGIGNDDGGAVVFVDPPESGAVVILARIVAPTQEVVYPDYGPFPAKTHEQALDKLTMLVQQNAERTLSAIQTPVGDEGRVLLPDVETRKLHYVFFDANGDVTVAEGTAIGGEGVKGIQIIPDSVTMLRVDSTDLSTPAIGVNNINGAGGLMKLTQQGDYVDFPNLPGGGIPVETLSNTPFLVFAVLIDDTTAQPGTDSTEMLTSYRQTNPSDPFGFVEIIGVNAPNQANHLVQVNEFGLIPQELTAFVGLRNLGPFRGDNLCDKVGDEIGDCTPPDYRNPSSRYPLADFQTGDFFAVTIFAGEELADNRISLYVDVGGSFVLQDTPVEANDGITYIGQGINDLLPDVPVGWYHQPGRFNLTIASLVTLETTGYSFIDPLDTNVQLAMNRLDSKLAVLNASQVLFDTSGGTIIIPPGTTHVQDAILALDAATVTLATTQTITGAKTFTAPTIFSAQASQTLAAEDPTQLVRKQEHDTKFAKDGLDSVRNTLRIAAVGTESPELRMEMLSGNSCRVSYVSNAGDTNFSSLFVRQGTGGDDSLFFMAVIDDASNIICQMTMHPDGNIAGLTGVTPARGRDLVNRDYVAFVAQELQDQVDTLQAQMAAMQIQLDAL